MSQLLSRIMLAIFMLPCAGLAYLTVYGVLSPPSGARGVLPLLGAPSDRRAVSFGLAGLTMILFCTAYWWLLWRGTVRWNGRRISFAILSLVVIGSIQPLIRLLISYLSNSKDFGAMISTILPTPLWLIALTVIMCETTSERAARASGKSALTCPTCGYNLTGLQSTRCPECGTQFTLDELLSLQKDRSDPDLNGVEAGR